MKILQTLFLDKNDQINGTERVCIDLCNEFIKAGHSVYLMCNSRVKPYIDKKVNLIDIKFTQNRFNPIFLYKIWLFIKQIRPDIIHSHNTKVLEIMSYAQIFTRKKIPIVFTKHNWFVKKKMKLANLRVAISPQTLELCKLSNKNGGGQYHHSQWYSF